MYQIPQLLKLPKLFHSISTREEGNMANSILGQVINFEGVLKNRKNFLKKVNVPINSCVCMWVLGEDGVKIADSRLAGVSMRDYKKAIKIDALITNKKGLYLFLLTADCAPVILYDRVNQVIGLVHVGWKGADLEIIKKVVKSCKNEFNSNPKDLIIGIGPAARKDSFIKESPSQVESPKWKGFIEPVGDNKYKVDFVGLCKSQLVEEGILEKNIFDSQIDTVKDNRFFSHYRDKNSPLNIQGRFVCVVGINK